MNALRHPRLLSLMGIGYDGPIMYLVTEYMANGDLKHYLKEHTLGTEQQTVIACQVFNMHRYKCYY